MRRTRVATTLLDDQPAQTIADPEESARGQETSRHTTINGEPVEFLCEARQSLLEVLRDTLQLTGAKEGCNNGNCGACTVLLDGAAGR